MSIVKESLNIEWSGHFVEFLLPKCSIHLYYRASLRWTRILFRKEELILVATCHENRDKLQRWATLLKRTLYKNTWGGEWTDYLPLFLLLLLLLLILVVAVFEIMKSAEEQSLYWLLIFECRAMYKRQIDIVLMRYITKSRTAIGETSQKQIFFQVWRKEKMISC